MDFSNVQWLDIANRALAMISGSMLSKMDQGTTEANYVTVLLPGVVEEVYASLPLDDISVYAELPRLADKSQTGSGFKYAYKIPESCACVRDVVLDGAYGRWQRTGSAILSDSSKVSIRYVPLPSSPHDAPYYVRSLIAVLLASRLAGPVAHNEAMAAMYRNQFETLLGRAITLSGQSRDQESWSDTTFWTEARG